MCVAKLLCILYNELTRIHTKEIIMNKIPRAEHPRPDRKRESWLSLNGEWDFCIDNSLVDKENGFEKIKAAQDKIIVPFCPESKLSGIGHTDFINSVWYRRDIEIPTVWDGKRIILHVDACDYKTDVYVNDNHVGSHTGGYTPFAFDITDYLTDKGNSVTINAVDDLRSERQVSGKQSHKLESYGCFYTRTTGIWQSVWLEAVEKAHTVSYKVYPSVSSSSVSIDTLVSEDAVGGVLNVRALYDGKEVGSASARILSRHVSLGITLSETHLWEVGCGRLYDLEFALEKDEKTDVMSGYFGLREVSLTKSNGLTINGKTVFGRFILDQGFYPDGLYTAPSDEALIFDIEAAIACGFNGARLHQKVFEPRFLYHADRLGYMVWGETGNWGLDHTLPENIYNFLPEWIEEVERDFSHPSLIGWCPFNETWDMNGRRQSNEFIDAVYDVTKAMDNTRPTIANSGSFPNSRTDANDFHDYEPDVELFRSNFKDASLGIVNDQLKRMDKDRQLCHAHLPIFVSEYGGIKWVMDGDKTAWGYGNDVKTEEEFFERLKGLTDALLDNEAIFGFCYTQLTDIEQEQNGLLTYNRTFKFSPDKYKAVFSRKAAIEE